LSGSNLDRHGEICTKRLNSKKTTTTTTTPATTTNVQTTTTSGQGSGNDIRACTDEWRIQAGCGGRPIYTCGNPVDYVNLRTGHFIRPHEFRELTENCVSTNVRPLQLDQETFDGNNCKDSFKLIRETQRCAYGGLTCSGTLTTWENQRNRKTVFGSDLDRHGEICTKRLNSKRTG